MLSSAIANITPAGYSIRTSLHGSPARYSSKVNQSGCAITSILVVLGEKTGFRKP